MPGPVIRGSTAATATLAPSSPASTQAGDCILVITWTRGTAGVPTHNIQTNYQTIRSHSHDDGSTDGRLSLAYIIASSGGINTYQAYTSSGGAADYSGIVVLQAGTFNSTTVGDVNNSSSLTTNAVPNPPSIVTPQAQCLVLAIAAWHLGSALTTTVTPPTNYAEVWEMAGSIQAELSVASRTIATATTEDPLTFNDDQAPNGTCCITVAFRPMAHTMTAAQASFALTGNTAGTREGHRSVAAQGSFALTGFDITTSVGGSGTTMPAAQGSFALSGQNANTRWGHKLAAAQSSFTLTGNPTGFVRTYRLPPTFGAYVLTGIAVNTFTGGGAPGGGAWAPPSSFRTGRRGSAGSRRI